MTGLYGAGDDSDIDQEKPVWEDDIDVDDIMPSQPAESSSSSSKKKKQKKKKNKDKANEDEGGVDIDAMDADVEPTYDDEEEWDGTEEMRKRKLDEYMDEVYGLEFNDMVGVFSFYLLLKKIVDACGVGCGNAHALQIHYDRTTDIRAHPCGGPHGHRSGPQSVRECEALCAVPCGEVGS
jgi:hypothetical protein